MGFFVNVGLLLAPSLRRLLGDGDPRLDAMPSHGIWQHRLIATGDAVPVGDHRFAPATEAETQDRAER